MDERGEPQTVHAGDDEDPAIRVQLGAEYVGMTRRPIDIDNEERVSVWDAGQPDAERRAHGGGSAVGAHDEARADLLLTAAWCVEDDAAHTPAILDDARDAPAVTHLHPRGGRGRLDQDALDLGVGQDEVRVRHPGQRERDVKEQPRVMMVELHPRDRECPRGSHPVERAPLGEEARDRRQQALAAVDVAGPRVAIDHEDAQIVRVGEREREGRTAHAGAHDDHVEFARAACHGVAPAHARDSNGAAADLNTFPRTPRSPDRWMGTASIAHSPPPRANAQRATAAAATR